MPEPVALGSDGSAGADRAVKRAVVHQAHCPVITARMR
jgi:hypothetical protein